MIPIRRTVPGMSPAALLAACGFVALALVAAAFESARSQAPPFSVDSAAVSVVTSDPLSSTSTCPVSEAPALTIGTLEGADAELFYRIRGAARLSNGSIVVADESSGQVRLFDSTGAPRRTMGGLGEGPGEFRNAWGVRALPGDTLWIGDYRPWRFNVFGPDGRWVRTVQLEPTYLNRSRGGGVLAGGISVNVRQIHASADDRFRHWDSLSVEVHSLDGALIGVLARLPYARWGRVSEGAQYRDAAPYFLDRLFEGRPSVHARGGTIAIVNREPEIRVFDAEFRLRRILRWPDPDRRVTAADVRAYRENVRKARRAAGGRLSRYDLANMSEERPVAELFPAVGSVLVGTDERIWARPYQRREDREPGTRRWMIFDRAGASAVTSVCPLGCSSTRWARLRARPNRG